MIAQNVAAKTSDIFILHARQPAFIARVVLHAKLEIIQVYQEAEAAELDKILGQMSSWYYHAHLKDSDSNA